MSQSSQRCLNTSEILSSCDSIPLSGICSFACCDEASPFFLKFCSVVLFFTHQQHKKSDMNSELLCFQIICKWFDQVINCYLGLFLLASVTEHTNCKPPKDTGSCLVHRAFSLPFDSCLSAQLLMGQWG